ncbi:DsrE family protein [Spartinivicinus ruber]|uniref:DsrE family protein n=1 Tax=Spartinivicinus ruber TaxID=2683272 RepID=UPI0013D7AB5B|nr:DsrE family protein [Spartinivicinus ruber]
MNLKNVKNTILILINFYSVHVAATEDILNSRNCVDTKWKDAKGESVSIEKKFGPGSMAVTRCLAKTKKVKVVYQVNQECKNSKCSSPYAIGNIINHVEDLTVTHGLKSKDYKIAVIIHGAGWKLALDNQAIKKHAQQNPFQKAVETLIEIPSVKVYFCQNTAASKEVIIANMIKGIRFVPSGVSAVSDFQGIGYQYVQP